MSALPTDHGGRPIGDHNMTAPSSRPGAIGPADTIVAGTAHDRERAGGRSNGSTGSGRGTRGQLRLVAASARPRRAEDPLPEQDSRGRKSHPATRSCSTRSDSRNWHPASGSRWIRSFRDESGREVAGRLTPPRNVRPRPSGPGRAARRASDETAAAPIPRTTTTLRAGRASVRALHSGPRRRSPPHPA